MTVHLNSSLVHSLFPEHHTSQSINLSDTLQKAFTSAAHMLSLECWVQYIHQIFCACYL